MSFAPHGEYAQCFQDYAYSLYARRRQLESLHRPSQPIDVSQEQIVKTLRKRLVGGYRNQAAGQFLKANSRVSIARILFSLTERASYQADILETFPVFALQANYNRSD
jgi:hypothetical protein